jgi:hypothetical protein
MIRQILMHAMWADWVPNNPQQHVIEHKITRVRTNRMARNERKDILAEFEETLVAVRFHVFSDETVSHSSPEAGRYRNGH